MNQDPDRFSPHTLDHLASLILGEPRHEDWMGPPPYRSASQIERWIRHYVPGFTLGPAGRYRETRDELERLNDVKEGREALKAMMAAVLDPRDYAQASSLLDDDIDTFNNSLWYDGYRLVREPRTIRLERIVDGPLLTDHLKDSLIRLDWDLVARDFERMWANCEPDPEDAITAACSLVESVCRSILVELDVEIPNKRTITVLYKVTAKELSLSSHHADLPADIAEDAKRVLGGLAGVIDGIGNLRTKTGDAHGREHTARRVDPRIARLAVGSAATLSQFVIESWQRKNAISNHAST